MQGEARQTAGGRTAGAEPLHLRVLGRVGIQGKLILCFMLLLIAGVGAACWVFVDEARQAMVELMGQRAAEMSQTLAMASSDPIATRDVATLKQIGEDLIKNRDLVTVGFFDVQAKALAIACRDRGVFLDDPGVVPRVKDNTEDLMRVRHSSSPVLGEYAEVIAPVFRYTAGPRGTKHLVGYVLVNVAESEQVQRIERIRVIALCAGALVLAISLPVVSVIVHGVLQPIRQLVAATQRIAGGDLDTRVDIHRSDMTGLLARSFNAMVQTIRSQQEALEAANEDLEEKVRQRTTQLEAANGRLTAEIAEKEDFLRAVSHDLNAPLRNISGMASMLLMKHREKFDDDVIHRLERIQKNVQVETDLIGELLELSRIKTRRQKMELVDTAGIVHEVADVLANDLSDKGVALVVDSQLPVLRCERARLRQVFQNLVDNAIKYMGDGSGGVKEIHVGCSARATGDVEFYVRDTGIGIEPEEIGKVFHVFRRGKNSQVQAVAGKGVGLSSVKSIVETYGGMIRVESQVGVGSRFTFTISGEHVPGAAATEAAEREVDTDESETTATVAKAS